ncbi:TetR/AcrR family transcriptional regulator [Ornithinibacillus salinisoli]|uniref:TetR/AcrR family transcriptional regulator n=1 Tax=Ornithinibacillus salinisoli TaxID=1848459 RepID=A0ABW4W1B1_9BACI
MLERGDHVNAKKVKLIEIGISLFAEKGYHATSIQEIANKAGISKGAFYLYFQSKDDFVTTSFQYFHQQISEQLEKIKQKNLVARVSLAEQITTLTEFIYSHKSFITMHIREDVSINGKTNEIIKKIKTEHFIWLKEKIYAVYGDKINPILLDCIIQLDGLIHGYFKWILMDDITIDRSAVGDYIVRRMDALVGSMIANKEESLAMMENFQMEINSQQVELTEIINELREKISVLPLEQTKLMELHEVLKEIESEVEKDAPKKIIMQGLLAHLQRYPILHEKCELIASYFRMELLD